MDIGERYIRFLLDNLDTRHVVIIGGRRSGKSFTILKWLKLLLSGEPKKALIIAATFPAIQLVIEDFQRATGLTVNGSAVYGFSCQMPNGSLFQFRAFDNPTKVQGTTCDYCYCEEFLNIPDEVIRVAMMSCTGQMFFAANPTRKTKLLKDIVLPDESNYLTTTYKDNPHLTAEQIAEFEAIKERSLRSDATLYDIFCAAVYVDGNFGDLAGRMFERLEYNTYQDYQDIPAEETVITDLAFGGADRTAICGFKKHNNKLYIHTYYYGSGSINAKSLAQTFVGCGFNSSTQIYADYGGIGRQILDKVITADNGEWTETELCQGFNVGNVIKKPVMESLMALMALDGIVIDDSSASTREEFEAAELDENGNMKNTNDHSIACARYAINYFHFTGQ